ncbi:glycoside hydrolase family 127 protein [bacterium]|nr:glycoside hydrolase family 127 protein [bacterium]
MDNFRIAAGLKTGFREGFFFSDSDAYKWLDAASRIMFHSSNPELKKLVDDFIELLAQTQQPDGYLYTYNQIHFPNQRWVDLQVEHEFYCLGHLIEAAVSHFEATTETKLLAIAEKTANLLVTEFGDSTPEFTDGHEEIEIALIKLWKVTERIEYLSLAKAFIDRRGTIRFFPFKMLRQVLDSGRRMNLVAKKRQVWLQEHPDYGTFKLPERNKNVVPFWTGPRFAISALNGKYNQQHAPVAEQKKAEGHAVRFSYLKTAEAMLAQIPGEENRRKSLRAIWRQMVTRRMYVTGGIGSLPLSEGFGRDYELDPEVAYAETCAALGSMFWSHEMANLTGEAPYEDLFEWQLYNAASVGIARDGCSYFYNNPLTSHGKIGRAEWYDIPCCPSNLSRTWASLGKYVCGFDHAEIRINQYLCSRIIIDSQRQITLQMDSELPWGNRVKLHLSMENPATFDLVMRLPAWAEGCEVLVNGQETEVHVSSLLPSEPSANGLDLFAARWMQLSRKFYANDEIELAFGMPIRLIKQDQHLPKCGGKFAVARGPIVYCLESIDHSFDIMFVKVKQESLQPVFAPDILDGTWVIRGENINGAPLVFIPYMLWANRGTSSMTVFVD